MDFEEIRRQAVIAMFADDLLSEKLVLKGGNALSLIHHIGYRFSLDLDFSLDGDFADVEDAKARIFRALRDRFDSIQLSVFDETFERRPSQQRPGQDKDWGGYKITFKVVPKEAAAKHEGDLEALRRAWMAQGPQLGRKFLIDISRNEYCHGKTAAELDHFQIFAYTLPMIAVEKIRAICQQMDGYTHRSQKTPRARDFFDIHSVVNQGVNLADHFDLFRAVFQIKNVPLQLLGEIKSAREFHRPDWAAVAATIPAESKPFDFYFDAVATEVETLKPLWIE